MKVLGGAGGATLGERGHAACKELGGESPSEGGGGEVSSTTVVLKSYTMLGNFFARNCWRPVLEN